MDARQANGAVHEVDVESENRACAQCGAGTAERSLKLHFTGIGGIGMSAIAQACLDDGISVTGSDRLGDHGDMTDTLRRLAAQGVSLFRQDGSGITDRTTHVIVSTAIENDNPDILKAASLGIPVIHRSEALVRLARGKKLIAVAGTSGKSTTTAILGHILGEAGFDPEVINGAAVPGWGGDGRVGSVRRGRSEWCVIEADESDRSFLRYTPDYAIITNQSADHFGIDETASLFDEFRSRVKCGVIDNLPAEDEITESAGWEVSFLFHGMKMSMPVPGVHNACNGWQAAELASKLGVADDVIARALASFPGVERRLQRIGYTASGALVIDDFGHNPAKISAALGAVRESFPVMAVLWRPHGYAPLRNMLEGLAGAFASSMRQDDLLLLLPVYDAGGTANRTINSDALRDRLLAEGFANVELVGSIEDAYARLSAFSVPDSAIVVAGARDPDLPRLAWRLVAEGGRASL